MESDVAAHYAISHGIRPVKPTSRPIQAHRGTEARRFRYADLIMVKPALLLTLMLCGCAKLTTLKIDNDGYYRFKKHPVEVKQPNSGMSVFDTDVSVDFVLGAGYWTFLGEWALQVFEQPPEYTAKDGFATRGAAGLAHFIENDRKPAGLNFKALKTEKTVVNGRLAFRGVGVDRGAKIPATIVATAIMLDTQIVVASVISKASDKSDAQIEDMDSYRGFNDWIVTIRETKPPLVTPKL
jgi:hypothetical protein